MVRRLACLALTALLAGTGCHAGLSGNTARQAPPIPRETVTVKNFVERHNRNASAVKSLTASPAIEVAGEGIRGARVNGMMAMERPRGFKLDLRAPMNGKVADIGSNDQEFWFWVSDKKDKSLYVCNYQDVKDSQLAVTYQPDWIVEAMGLREISPRDAATLVARPGESEGQIVLTQSRADNRGGMLTKETVVDERSGRIKEHKLWAGPKKDLLARATVLQYEETVLKPTDEDPSGSTIQLPKRFKLEWVVEKFSLDVTMSDVKVNRVFAPDQRTALFKEPQIAGTTRVNLAQVAAQSGTASRVYESMPAPRSGVRLGQPEPMRTEVEGAYRGRRDEAPGRSELSANVTRASSEVVSAPVPRGLDPEAYRASTTRRTWRPSLLDR